MPEIDGWNYRENYFGENEENYWKLVLAKPADEGFAEFYIVNVTVASDSLYVTGYNVPENDLEGFGLDHEKVERGGYEPGPHDIYDLDFTQSLGEISDRKEVPKRNLSVEHYVEELIERIEEN